MKNGIVVRLAPVMALDSVLDEPLIGMAPWSGGRYVKYEDYLHERQTVEKLRRQLAKRKRRDARKAPKAQEQDCRPLLVDSEEPTYYDAELHNWDMGKSIWSDKIIAEGHIQNDKKHRFADGAYVYTSEILRKERRHDGLFIYTKNSVYNLVGEQYVDSDD